MGVPSFYRWLTKKYESVVVDAKEENGFCVDSSLSNPNGMEFDNLYLDMNGIIHPCFHPEENDHMGTPKTFDEVFNNIFGSIDRLFNIVRPRKLLYLAIDGVAPRAKMNQQRTRRFRTAKDAEEVEKEEDRLRREFLLDGKQVLPKQETELFDVNIITPGTEFMFKLSKELQTYVHLRMKNNTGWKNVKVLLSDSSVPGEGEHKIFSFIRLQRTFPEYDPNTRHCVYGLDADLIMLALATHEIHFSILREDIMVQVPNSGDHTTQVLASCEPENMTKSKESFEKWAETELSKKSAKRPYQFLHLWILREYLKMDMEIKNPPHEKFQPDFERLIDDFIFICFFSGNDFLPHMPSLYLHEGGIDLLMHVYKTEFKVLGGYLVDMQRVNDIKNSGYVKLNRVEKFILLVGNYEENIFKKRADLRERILKKILKESENSQYAENEDSGTIGIDLSTLKISGSCSEKMHTCSNGDNDPEVILENTKELKDKLKEYSRKAADNFQNGGLRTDKIKLHLPGYRERYYMEKFELTSPVDVESTRRAVVEKYNEGLCWVTLYYFAGVPSWTWYYPYHYGPFASDMKGLSRVKPLFQKGLPFKPFEQLMGVFPPRSAHALPIPYQRLMKDETSSIIDFYRTDFQVDVDGTRFTWQGICKLPFIEEARLLEETRKLESELMGDEEIRNSEGVDILFLGRTSSDIISDHQSTDSNRNNNELRIDAKLSGGLNGFLLFKMGGNEADGLLQSDHSDVLCVYYKLPPHRVHKLPPHRVHNPRLLEGVFVPEETVTEADIHETQLWHEYQGHRPVTRLQNPHRQWKTDKRVTNSTPAVIMKSAGIGWGSGRGKVTAEEAERTLTAPGQPPKSTPGLNFGGSSSTGHYRPHNFNSPLQRNNEKWRPIFGRGTTGITGTFKPNQPQVYNVQQAIRRGETQTAEKSRSDQQENVSQARNFGRGETEAPNHPVNVWQTSFGRGETQSAWTLTSNRLATNNVWRETGPARGQTQAAVWRETGPARGQTQAAVWRETGPARGQTQAAWTLSSNERANSNVWRATNSSIGDARAGMTVRPNQPANNNPWGLTRSGRPGNWRSGESREQ